ncbi:hypothetical protein RND71_028632 [Anisodus tanguticus]|uniref:Reverse transcriptase Ty1/copia-type domain-containing protein n=1 Tax=Anisodus tanguticus TaxID=243964 RepID=A0AAE1RIS9_9SOLA|nr:hypothetical protein RND71_028632 [Anisodus tanguticus]
MTTMLHVYVDNIIFTASDAAFLENIILRLGSAFAIKDLGPLNLFLGIQVVRTRAGLSLSQRHYISSLLECDKMQQCKPLVTPMSTSTKLHKNDSPHFHDPSLYRHIVGALQYFTLTRPDLSFVVNKVCKYMHNPSVNQWAVVKRILRYLQYTKDMCLFIPKFDTKFFQAFTDADWAGSLDDKKSTGGYAIFMGSALVSWSSKKQCTVARPSTESEYKALADEPPS